MPDIERPARIRSYFKVWLHTKGCENQGENYDNPQDIDILEEQEKILPHGPIGFLCPKIEITPGIPEDVLNIVSEYLSDKISTFDLANQMEKIKRQHIKKLETTMIA